MPAVGGFAVHKMRAKHDHVALCKKTKENCKEDNPPRYDLKKYFTQLSPSKYNEKMMNSIWGRYNRNSPHNFKKNNAAEFGEEQLQQSITAAKDLAKPLYKPGINAIPDQTPFVAAAVAAAGFGTIYSQENNPHLDQEHHPKQEHKQHHKNEDHGPLGAHGHIHGHGHHGNFHKHHDHSHYEQLWSFSAI